MSPFSRFEYDAQGQILVLYQNTLTFSQKRPLMLRLNIRSGFYHPGMNPLYFRKVLVSTFDKKGNEVISLWVRNLIE